jgi:hypothetical protein
MEILWAVDVSRPKLTDTEKQMQIMGVNSFMAGIQFLLA